MRNYVATLGSCCGHKTVEFKSDKTGIALVRQTKQLLNCVGFKMQLIVVSGDFKQWTSPDFSMTLKPID